MRSVNIVLNEAKHFWSRSITVLGLISGLPFMFGSLTFGDSSDTADKDGSLQCLMHLIVFKLPTRLPFALRVQWLTVFVNRDRDRDLIDHFMPKFSTG